MKKKIFMLLLIASCLMTPIHILAEGCDTETATIVDEDTPKVEVRKDTTNYILHSLHYPLDF